LAAGIGVACNGSAAHFEADDQYFQTAHVMKGEKLAVALLGVRTLYPT
jgi:hypothetical protein